MKTLLLAVVTGMLMFGCAAAGPEPVSATSTLAVYASEPCLLRLGDPVLFQGVAIGKVVAIEHLAVPRGSLTARVVAEVQSDPRPCLKADHKISIEDRGLLGGKLLRISAGTAAAPASPGGDLVASAR